MDNFAGFFYLSVHLSVLFICFAWSRRMSSPHTPLFVVRSVIGVSYLCVLFRGTAVLKPRLERAKFKMLKFLSRCSSSSSSSQQQQQQQQYCCVTAQTSTPYTPQHNKQRRMIPQHFISKSGQLGTRSTPLQQPSKQPASRRR